MLWDISMICALRRLVVFCRFGFPVDAGKQRAVDGQVFGYVTCGKEPSQLPFFLAGGFSLEIFFQQIVYLHSGVLLFLSCMVLR